MPRKKNTRAAQGTGSIRKKTVLREGREYTYWEARVTVGVECLKHLIHFYCSSFFGC